MVNCPNSDSKAFTFIYIAFTWLKRVTVPDGHELYKWKKEKIGKKRRKELVVITHHGLNRKIEKKKGIHGLGRPQTEWKIEKKKKRKRKNDLDWEEYDDDELVHAHHHNYRLHAFIFNYRLI